MPPLYAKNKERKKRDFFIFFLWETETGLLSRLLRNFEVGVQKHPRLFTRGTVAYYLNARYYAKKLGKIYHIGSVVGPGAFNNCSSEIIPGAFGLVNHSMYVILSLFGLHQANSLFIYVNKLANLQ